MLKIVCIARTPYGLLCLFICLRRLIMKTLFIITALVAFHTLAQATKTTDTNKTVLTTVQSVLLSTK